jgi:hypothetical protein
VLIRASPRGSKFKRQRESLEQGSPLNVQMLPRRIPPVTASSYRASRGSGPPDASLLLRKKLPGWERIRRFTLPFRPPDHAATGASAQSNSFFKLNFGARA